MSRGVCLSIIAHCHCSLFAIHLRTILVSIKVKLPSARYKGVWGSGVQPHAFLSSTMGEVFSFTSGSLYPRVKKAGTHLRGGSVGPRSGLALSFFFFWRRDISQTPVGNGTKIPRLSSP